MDVFSDFWNFNFFGFWFYNDVLWQGLNFLSVLNFLKRFFKFIKLLGKFNNLLTSCKFPFYRFSNNIPKLQILSHNFKCQLSSIFIVRFYQSHYLLIYPMSINLELCRFKQLIKCNYCSSIESVIILLTLLPMRTVK